MKFSDYELKTANRAIKESLESSYPPQPIYDKKNLWRNTLIEIQNCTRHTQQLALFLVIEKYRRQTHSWWFPLSGKDAVNHLVAEKLNAPHSGISTHNLSDVLGVLRNELNQVLLDDEYGLFRQQRQEIALRVADFLELRPTATPEDIYPDPIQWDDYPDQQLHNWTGWTPFPEQALQDV